MNAPVVAIEDLPVGPAHAAVALSQGPDANTVNATVAVRCARTHQVAFFTAGSELLELRSTSIAMEAALSFAESMGFLFDDEEVEIRGAEGSRKAAKIWQRFVQGDPEETDLPDAPEFGQASVEVEHDDELGPILSSIAHDLNEAESREQSGEDSEPSLAAGSDPEPPHQGEEMPFWLAIPGEGVPRPSAPAPDASDSPDDRIDAFAARAEGSSPKTDDSWALETGPEFDPKNRELLMNALAETAVDRVCGSLQPPGPGLSKFRLKPSEADPHGDPRMDSRTREEHTPGAEKAEDETHREDVNSPHKTRYHETTRRPHLLLRLNSRF